MNEQISVSRIEDWAYGLLKGRVSEHVVAGGVPSLLSDGWEDMAAVDVVKVEDRSEYGRVRGRALVNVWVYVAPTSAGRKRLGRIESAETALSEIVERGVDEHHSVSELYREQGYDNFLGWHYVMAAWTVEVY